VNPSAARDRRVSCRAIHWHDVLHVR